MLRITPSSEQRTKIEEARLNGLALVMEESAKHEDLRTARARRFKAIRQGGEFNGEFVSLQNTLIDTFDHLIKTEPRVKTKVEANIERLHLTAKISEICPVLASR